MEFECLRMWENNMKKNVQSESKAQTVTITSSSARHGPLPLIQTHNHEDFTYLPRIDIRVHFRRLEQMM